MLDLIDCSAALVSDRFKASPHQQGTSDVIALDAGFAAQDRLNAR